MPIDVKYRDKDGQIKTTSVHRAEDTGDGFVRVDREHRTIVDGHTSTKYIPKEDIVEVRNRETTVGDTDFHRPLADDIRGAIDRFNKWRSGK